MDFADNNQEQTSITDDVLLHRDLQLGSGDTTNKTIPKIILAAIHRFQRLKKSDSQYLRRLLSLKQQIDFLPDDANEKIYVNNALLRSVYEMNERTRKLIVTDTLAKKLEHCKSSCANSAK
ncbi:hypothetical protein NPIL_619201 [Nephila pilipes]|uniref:Uncharacterized protein n=1 Tax=Nephila pilipes TaxID=299642 RepID=A0A8X6IW67_NEPPI|nr:hypothetical protein NPIL_619201 [Nephila pilipes]